MKTMINEAETFYEPPKLATLELEVCEFMCISELEVTNPFEGEEEDW